MNKVILGYVWFSKSLKENARERKERKREGKKYILRGKVKGKKKWKKEEEERNRFKVNKLFLYTTSNFFHLFDFSI